MIKVPGTEAGLPAIEELTRRGVNVNVTLLFAIERYEQVIDAFLRGLTARAAEGAPLDAIASVASFFVSRIDTKVDAQLPERLAAARSRRDRQRARRLPALPDQVRRSGMGAPPGARSPDPASAVGQHRHQGPGLLRRALRLRADRARRDQHDARADAARVRRPRRGRCARSTPTHRRLSELSPKPTAPGSTSTQSPRSSSARASSRSATPTTSCSTASRASSVPSRRPAARAERDSGVYPALITRSRPGSRADRRRGGRRPRDAVGAARAGLRSARHHDPRARAQVHQPVDERRPAVQAPAGPRPQARGHRRRARRALAPGGAGPRRARAATA